MRLLLLDLLGRFFLLRRLRAWLDVNARGRYPAGGVGVVGGGALGEGGDCAQAAICAPLPARHNAKSVVSKADARNALNVITLVLVDIT